MANIHEQHINIKFGLKLGKMFTETREMMKNVCGDQCISHTRGYEWFKRFKDSRQTTHDELLLEQPSTSFDNAGNSRRVQHIDRIMS
jgi:hypothetical protein